MEITKVLLPSPVVIPKPSRMEGGPGGRVALSAYTYYGGASWPYFVLHIPEEYVNVTRDGDVFLREGAYSVRAVEGGPFVEVAFEPIPPHPDIPIGFGVGGRLFVAEAVGATTGVGTTGMEAMEAMEVVVGDYWSLIAAQRGSRIAVETPRGLAYYHIGRGGPSPCSGAVRVFVPEEIELPDTAHIFTEYC